MDHIKELCARRWSSEDATDARAAIATLAARLEAMESDNARLATERDAAEAARAIAQTDREAAAVRLLELERAVRAYVNSCNAWSIHCSVCEPCAEGDGEDCSDGLAVILGERVARVALRALVATPPVQP